MNLNLKYPCEIIFHEDLDPKKYNQYSIKFFDIPEAITEGETLEHSIEMAKSVLSVCLDAYKNRNRNFPEPSKIEGENIFYIEVELGKSTSYTKYHQKNYENNKSKIIDKKKKKESVLKDAGYKNLRELILEEVAKKLDYIKQKRNLKNKRDVLTYIINKEYEEITSM